MCWKPSFSDKEGMCRKPRFPHYIKNEYMINIILITIKNVCKYIKYLNQLCVHEQLLSIFL